MVVNKRRSFRCTLQISVDLFEAKMTSCLARSSVETIVLTGGSSDYRQQHVLGEGCFGKVAQCLNLDTKETVAVKVLKQRRQYDLEAKREVRTSALI